MTFPELVTAYLKEGTELLKNKILDYLNANNFSEEDWLPIIDLLLIPIQIRLVPLPGLL